MLIRWKSKDKTSNKNSTGDGSGSKKKRKFVKEEEEWNADGKARYPSETSSTGKLECEGVNDNSGRRIGGIGIGINSGISLALHSRSTSVVSGRSREEPRRHTLSGNHQPATLLHHQQCGTMPASSSTIGVTSVVAQSIHPLHPRHLPPPHSQYGASSRQTTMDLEMGTKSRQKKITWNKKFCLIFKASKHGMQLEINTNLEEAKNNSTTHTANNNSRSSCYNCTKQPTPCFHSGHKNFEVHHFGFQKDASRNCGLKLWKNYTLIVEATEMKLMDGNRVMYIWRYKYIRKYGCRDGNFQVLCIE